MIRYIAASLLLLLVWIGVAQAAIETFNYANDAERERFQALTRELRCPKCQNQDLADSNAPIAADLRREIHRLMEEGNSNEQIIDYLVARYGEFVMYRPPVEKRTWLLWYGPAAFLLIGFCIILIVVRRRRHEALPSHVQLSADEQARLASLLEKKNS
ncbi:cytochrome c-type biogenesis protein CcmH [Pseudomonas asuensis]|uniref:Cytochrome c-type biogenesis protein n=1 Tax=Pseudomonas asuensis TaxID=1825787 RepID=A0ABQ2GLW3_9PSED|nr:cytochrome c-type biogenesis protein [Pseudomonas asuensis]GGM02764.1 cytochrome c-type biogenesis protein CcmH [Pseudomonas asuensis]